jgi:glycosyltransferase involved in cell wall biosynthesis
MKLLICTQAVDKNDPMLGFFHRWIEEFAKHFEQIYVICLKEGVHDLPKNVSVYSLGKEEGENWGKYIARFYRHLFNLRGAYDRVFVHMNPHYIMLGGVYWIIARIPVFFWRNHARMNIMTSIAAHFAKHVFYTSPFACTSRYAHARQMPVGIDTHVFAPEVDDREKKGGVKKILFLGRLSPVKRVELFLAMAPLLPHGYEVHVYGDAPAKDQMYYATLTQHIPSNVFFHRGVTNDETPEIYRAHDVYVNLTPEGSMDKTVLEAAACGVSVLVSNTSFSGTLPDFSIVKEVTPSHLVQALVSIAEMSDEEKKNVSITTRKNIIENHSLEKLAIMLYNYME